MKRRTLTNDYEALKNVFGFIEPTGVEAYLFPPTEKNPTPYKGCLQFKYSFTEESGRRDYNRLAFFPLESLWVDDFGSSMIICKAVASVIQNPVMPETRNALVVASALSLFGHKDMRKDSQEMALIADRAATTVTYISGSHGGNEAYKTYREGESTGYRKVPIFDNATLALKAVINVVGAATGNVVAGANLVDLSRINTDILREVGFVEVKDRLGKAPSMWMGDPNKLILDSNQEYYTTNKRINYDTYGYQRGNGKKMAELVMDRLTLALG